MRHGQRIRSIVSRIGKKLGHWLLVLLWMMLIFYLSGRPDLPHHPEHFVDLIAKKVGHVAEYGILAGLVWWACPRSGERESRRIILYAFVFSALYAISDEVHQFFVPGRNAQVFDVGFDLLGAVMALLLISNLVGRREV